MHGYSVVVMIYLDPIQKVDPMVQKYLDPSEIYFILLQKSYQDWTPHHLKNGPNISTEIFDFPYTMRSFYF